MKRFLTLTAVLAITASLAACGNNNASNGGNANTETATEAVTAIAANEGAEDTTTADESAAEEETAANSEAAAEEESAAEGGAVDDVPVEENTTINFTGESGATYVMESSIGEAVITIYGKDGNSLNELKWTGAFEDGVYTYTDPNNIVYTLKEGENGTSILEGQDGYSDVLSIVTE